MFVIWVGYMGDDYIYYVLFSVNSFIVKLLDLLVFGLFLFINGDFECNCLLMDYSLIFWWIYVEFKYVFWWLLSEMSYWLDYVFWLDLFWMMYFYNIVWYLLVLVLVFRLYRIILSVFLVGVFVLVVYVLDSSYGFVVSWIVNRNVLIVLSFVFVSLFLYMCWCRE